MAKAAKKAAPVVRDNSAALEMNLDGDVYHVYLQHRHLWGNEAVLRLLVDVSRVIGLQEDREAEAREEGHKEGYDEGMTDGKAEMRGDILESHGKPLCDAFDELKEALTAEVLCQVDVNASEKLTQLEAQVDDLYKELHNDQ